MYTCWGIPITHAFGKPRTPQEAATIRDRLRHDAYMRDRGTYLNDPHPEQPRGTSLPPNAGTLRAMAVWKEQQEQQQQQQQPQQGGGGGYGAGETSGRGPGSPGTTLGRGVRRPSGGGGGGGSPVHLPRLYGSGSGSGSPGLGISPGRGAHGRVGQQGTAQEPGALVAGWRRRDIGIVGGWDLWGWDGAQWPQRQLCW